jgi:hypothetical protein
VSKSTQSRTAAPSAAQEEASQSAGRAAGYCWARNPDEPGRCTWPPHTSGSHKDRYAKTEWT